MKKKSIKNLKLNKKTISNIDVKAKGGRYEDRDRFTGSCGETCTLCNLSCWSIC